MGYLKEKASKFGHQQIIKDPKVKDYLKKCFVPNVDNISQSDFSEFSNDFENIKDKFDTNIEKIVVVDGGFQVVEIDDNFPSAQIAYYSVGLLSFDRQLVKNLETQLTIDPDDIGKLKNLHRYNFVLPVKIVKFKSKTFETTIRETIYEIFKTNELWEESLIDTVKWLIFEEYKDGKGIAEISCTNPYCNNRVKFTKKSQNYKDNINDTIKCSKCNTVHYITDFFELHTVVDDFNGASAIVSYVMSAFEVNLVLTLYRIAYENDKREILSKLLFIKDGSLALFSRLDDFLFKKIRPFIKKLYEDSSKDKKSYVNWIGLDKSGMFVEHLQNIEKFLDNDTLLLPNTNYMRKYITGDTDSVFGYKTYFGIKMLFKKDDSLSFVVDFLLPYVNKKGEPDDYLNYIKKPNINDFLNLKSVIGILCDLRCDLYNKSFIPVTLVNKMVSLSDVPSNKLLSIFSNDEIKR